MRKKLFAMFAVGAMMIAMLAGCGGSEGSVPEAGSGAGVVNEPEASTCFKDNIIETDDFKIEITGYKVIPVGEAGNEYGDKPVIAFWYNTTNVSGKEIDPNTAWIFNVTAIQDNDPNAINTLEVGMAPDMSFIDSQLETIKKGGTVANAVAYELDDLETPVLLQVKDLITDEVCGEQTFKIK